MHPAASILFHTGIPLPVDHGDDILAAMVRIRLEIADLTRDMAALVRSLADRGETVFGVDRLPPALVIEEARVVEADDPPAPPAALPRELADLGCEAAACVRCGLSKHRNHVVFGGGDGASGVMLVGEGPGRTEDETGVPFVGRAGALLDRMTAAAGFRREELYITNIVKCRPPRNRDPRPDEVQSCRPYLNRQVETLKPRLIVAIGRPSAQSLLRTGLSLSRLRGRIHSIAEIPLIVTYHPAYLLRSPSQKPQAWEDWRRIRDLLARVRSGGEAPVDGEVVPL